MSRVEPEYKLLESWEEPSPNQELSRGRWLWITKNITRNLICVEAQLLVHSGLFQRLTVLHLELILRNTRLYQVKKYPNSQRSFKKNRREFKLTMRKSVQRRREREKRNKEGLIKYNFTTTAWKKERKLSSIFNVSAGLLFASFESANRHWN